MFSKIEKLVTPPEGLSKFADPVLRVATSLIFIIGGLGHFGAHDIMLARMEASPWRDVIFMFGDPSYLLWLSGVIFIVFGITLALGLVTRLSALLIFLTLLPITVTIHFAPDHVGPLFKNVAILGALFFIFCRGSGSYAIDKLLQDR
ncbi:MAG: DoxX family protein [Sphingorhabdus sp.]